MHGPETLSTSYLVEPLPREISILHLGIALLFYGHWALQEGLSWHHMQMLSDEVTGIQEWIGHEVQQIF